MNIHNLCLCFSSFAFGVEMCDLMVLIPNRAFLFTLYSFNNNQFLSKNMQFVHLDFLSTRAPLFNTYHFVGYERLCFPAYSLSTALSNLRNYNMFVQRIYKTVIKNIEAT